MDNYNNLLNALKIIDTAKSQLWDSEGTSPAWEFLVHAKRHLHSQATAALRGETN